jgi:hypothetical protein
VIDRRISEAKAATLFVVKLGYALPKYDFDRQGFATQVGESSFVYFNGVPYVVRFTNWDQLDFIPIEESRARSLQPMLGSYEKAPPEHRVDLPNPDVDTVSFGLRIVFHDGTNLSKE